MPLQATSGAASYDAFGGGAAAVPTFVEDIFSTYLYTGNGSTQNIVNGVDLSTKGGLVWVKSRAGSIDDHILVDTARGTSSGLRSNLTNAASGSGGFTSFNTDGFSFDSSFAIRNAPSTTYASWTFRKQPKFFDVVTWTGDGTSRAIAHNLGSTPGCIIVKRLNFANDWAVYHRATSATPWNDVGVLNLTDAWYVGSGSPFFGAAPTSTTFTVNTALNNTGDTYVAYVFAHNAGGFGLTGTDNVISCGSFTTTTGGVADVNLGYEPQWVMMKATNNSASNWEIYDVMRGSSNSGSSYLNANTSGAEGSTTAYRPMIPTATGFTTSGWWGSGLDMIYIAIRRGPMKVPTSGTSVFSPTGWTGSMATRTNTTGFVTDLNISRMWFNFSSASNLGAYWETRLTGATKYLHSDATDAEASQTDGLTSFASNTGITFGADSTVQAWNYDNNYRNWSFKRAPSYMDVVCYTGTGASSQVLTHNLTVTPQLTIFKKRSASNPWDVVSGNTSYLQLNENFAASPDTSIAATATTITAPLGAGNGLNASGATYVAYLFATCAGVSKVGSYTGNGSSQTINCGFTAGARFVMVKATSTTGNWIVADTNSIASDRALYMNNADREVSGNDWIDIASSGFIVNQTATIAANTNGVTYIFLAIA